MVRLAVTGPTRTAELVLPRHDHITLIIERSGRYYEEELLCAIRERRPHGTFADVGAHFGNHSVFFGLECDAERILAFEPNPLSFAGLRTNLSENGLTERATPLHVAIHPSWRQVTIEEPEWRPEPDNPALTNSGLSRVVEATGDTVVAAAPLDEALSPYDSIGLIKVDVEGGGAEVLLSGRETIIRDRPLLVVEVLSADELYRLRELVEPLGYVPSGPYSWTPTWIWEVR